MVVFSRLDRDIGVWGELCLYGWRLDCLVVSVKVLCYVSVSELHDSTKGDRRIYYI